MFRLVYALTFLVTGHGAVSVPRSQVFCFKKQENMFIIHPSFRHDSGRNPGLARTGFRL